MFLHCLSPSHFSPLLYCLDIEAAQWVGESLIHGRCSSRGSGTGTGLSSSASPSPAPSSPSSLSASPRKTRRIHHSCRGTKGTEVGCSAAALLACSMAMNNNGDWWSWILSSTHVGLVVGCCFHSSRRFGFVSSSESPIFTLSTEERLWCPSIFWFF